MLMEFWSDIKNVENASTEDIQSDILAYLQLLEESKERESQLKEVMERAISVIDIWWNEPDRQAVTMRGILSRGMSELYPLPQAIKATESPSDSGSRKGSGGSHE